MPSVKEAASQVNGVVQQQSSGATYLPMSSPHANPSAFQSSSSLPSLSLSSRINSTNLNRFIIDFVFVSQLGVQSRLYGSRVWRSDSQFFPTESKTLDESSLGNELQPVLI